MRFFREIGAGRGGLRASFIGVVLDGLLIAGLPVGSNSTGYARVPRARGAWGWPMTSRAPTSGPVHLLLWLAVGQAIRRGNKFLNFIQNLPRRVYRVNELLERMGLDPSSPGDKPTSESIEALPLLAERRLRRWLHR